MLPRGFSYEEFLSRGNIILQDEDDFVILERLTDRVYSWHYVFVSRGSLAMKKASLFLKEALSLVPVIIGIVPEGRREVTIMSRKLGFRPLEGSCLYITKEMENG